MKTIIRRVQDETIEQIAAEATEIWKRGGLVAFPTETVYGLGGNGLDREASKKIYEAKGRPSDNPLILHIAEKEQVKHLISHMNEAGRKLMDRFWPGPLTLIFPKAECIPLETTGGLDTVAIRMPSHPVAQALLRKSELPIAAPSANLSGRPSPTLASHVIEDMDGRIDMIVDGGELGIGVESTIVDVTGKIPTILRPGYITKEMIQEVVGQVDVDPAVMGGMGEKIKPKAPGMKYRHYAPKAPMFLVEGEIGKVADAINRVLEKAKQDGKKIGILASEENEKKYQGGVVKVAGSHRELDCVAHNLYRILREFDKEGVDEIYSESFEGEEFGAAIMNRMKKAAGQQVINANELKDKIEQI